jgi:hypothetical protein
METKTQVKVLLLFTLFIYIYYLFHGLKFPIPELGDSFDYHIPIAKMILSGQIINPGHTPLGQWYYPGASNAFHALFIFLHIPLTLSNLLPTFLLGVCLFFLGRSFKLAAWLSMLFSLSVISLTVFHRWGNAVSIDVWVAVYVASTLTLLKQARYTNWTYIWIGVLWGMLLGSKYLVGIYPVILFLGYGKEFLKQFSWKRALSFFTPIIILGGFWYMRNYVLTGNPFYPLSTFGFQGDGLFTHTPSVWQTLLMYPVDFVNALFSEYKLFSIGIVLLPVYMLTRWKTVNPELKRLFLVGFGCFLVFCLFPMDPISWVIVSSLRYSFTFTILFILMLFLLAVSWKKEKELGYLALLSAFPVLTMAYYPKLIIPVAFLFYLFAHFLELKLDKSDKIT